MAITPLNQLDIYRIVHDFDRDHFKIAKPLRDDQAGRVIVIIQLERMMGSFGIPTEIIDDIMRRCLKDSPSVGALLMCYKNTPAIVMLHPLPLSYNTHYINTASRLVLVQLKQASAEGGLDSYLQLMRWVFAHHFQKLPFDQKVELIRTSNITPSEQKSTIQKPELLGTILDPTLWGKAKVKLQLLYWKVQFAVAWALENNILKWGIPGTCIALFSGFILSAFAGKFSFELIAISLKLFFSFVIAFFNYLDATMVSLAACLTMVCLGVSLQVPIYPKSVRDNGQWMTLVGMHCCRIAICMVVPTEILAETQSLQQLLLQSINTTKITREQNNSANAHLPGLIDQWMQLVDPSDINTGSLQIDTQEFKRLA